MEKEDIIYVITNGFQLLIEMIEDDSEANLTEIIEAYSKFFIVLDFKELKQQIPLFILLADFAIKYKSECCMQILLNEMEYPSEDYLIIPFEQLNEDVLAKLKDLGQIGTNKESYKSIYEWIINDDFKTETLPLTPFDAMFISSNMNIFSIIRYLLDNGCDMNQISIYDVNLYCKR